MKWFLLVALLVLPILGCSGGDAPATATPSGAATPAQTPTSVGTSAPPVDGTVAPQNAGDTVPVSIKSNPDPVSGVALLRDVRVGAHPENGGWDRIVFEFDRVRPAGEVSYSDDIFQCGSGEKVDPAGEATILVRFSPADAHNEAGQATIKSQQITGPGNVILDSRQICDFEAHVNWAVGVKSKKPFKVTLLENPTRVVIDVKQ